MNNQIKKILAINNNRLPVYDYIRCFATICVLAIHQIGIDLALNSYLAGTTLYHALTVIRWLLFASNAMFIMLSGALLLKYKDESIITYFVKRVSKIAIPLVVYFIVYYLYLIRYGLIQPVSVKILFKWIVTADYNQVSAGHFWLIYRMLVLYIAFMFMRRFIKNISFQKLTIICCLTTIALTITTALSYDYTSNILIEIILWSLISVVGYWMSLEEARKYDYLVFVMGGISIIIIVILYRYRPESRFLTNNLSPLKILLAMGIFALFFTIKLKCCYIIQLLSKYSYGILLIHCLCIAYIHWKGFSINSLMFNGAGCLIKLLVLLLISFIAAFIIDNTIVAFINGILKFSLKIIRSAKRNY